MLKKLAILIALLVGAFIITGFLLAVGYEIGSRLGWHPYGPARATLAMALIFLGDVLISLQRRKSKQTNRKWADVGLLIGLIAFFLAGST